MQRVKVKKENEAIRPHFVVVLLKMKRKCNIAIDITKNQQFAISDTFDQIFGIVTTPRKKIDSYQEKFDLVFISISIICQLRRRWIHPFNVIS